MRTLPGVLARLVLAGVFVALGVLKARDPIAFLKILREYGVLAPGLPMNAAAAVLPYFEIGLGLLLFFGVAVRGAALVSLALLALFSAALVHRGMAVAEARELAFCAVSFDCGCGTGVVPLCRKLGENAVLLLLSGYVLASSKALSFALWAAPGRRRRRGQDGPPPVA